MIEHRHHPRELVDWLEDSVDKNDDENAAMCALNSLVKKGVLRKEKLSIGTRFYLNNQGKIDNVFVTKIQILLLSCQYLHTIVAEISWDTF